MMFDATFGYFVLSRGHRAIAFWLLAGNFKRGQLALGRLARVPHLVATKKREKTQQELDIIMVTVMHRPPSVTVGLQLAGIYLHSVMSLTRSWFENRVVGFCFFFPI